MRALEPLTRDYAAPAGNERQLSKQLGKPAGPPFLLASGRPSLIL